MNHDLRLQVEGALLERLINRALDQGASFAQIRRIGPRGMQIASDESSIRILIDLCKRYGLNCRMLHRGGWTALRDVIRTRWTLLPGLCICALICGLFLSRVWMVDIAFTGPCAHLGVEQRILDDLQTGGIYMGMPIRALNTDLLQAQLMAQAGNYSFIGVRSQGIRLLIEASPEVPAPEIYQIDHARDLVADRDGIIESIAVYSGSACVEIGDTVRRGQVLIRGEETIGTDPETGEDITVPVSALGKIIARCWFEGTAEGQIISETHRRTGNRVTACRLKLMDWSLDLIECDGYANEETEDQSIPLVGLFLPLEIQKRVHWEVESISGAADINALEAQLISFARADALRSMDQLHMEYEIASAWTDAQQNGNTLRVRAVYEIYTDIAVTRDAWIEEVN